MKIRLAIVLRIIAFFLGGVVAVLAALCALLWFSFDAQHSAQALKQHFKEHHQRNLILSEAPQLSLWPRPALLLTRSALSETDSAELFASIESLRLELAIQPLLHRRFELNGLRAEGLSMRLKRSEKAAWNFTPLLAENQTSPLPGWQSRLAWLEIRSGKFSLELAGREHPVLLKDFTLSAKLPQGRAGRLKWQGQLSDTASASELSARGQATIEAAESLASGALRNADLVVDGNLQRLKGASLRLQAQRLLWARGGAEGSLSALQGVLRGAAGKQSVELQLSSPDLGWRGHALQGKAFESRLTLRTVAGSSEFKLSLPELSAEGEHGFQTEAARLSWQEQADKQAGSSAQLLLRLEADLRKPALQASQISGELKLQHPRLQSAAGRIGLSGDFNWQADGSESKLKIAVNQDQLLLNARLQQLWPLIGRFDLRAESFNLDQLLIRKTSGQKLPPLRWPDLADHALKGQIQLLNLRAGGVLLTRLQGPLRLQDGQLSAEGFRLSVYEGELAGSLQADSRSGQASIQGDFRNLLLERLALETNTPIPLTGRLSGSYRLVSIFKPGQSPLAALHGAVRWNLAHAGLRGLDLQRSLRELTPDILAQRMSARSPGRDESSELGTASSRFVIENSRIQAERIEAANRWLKLSGSGQADMQRGEMDFKLQAKLLPAAPPALAKLRGKPLPLRIKGPLLHPDLRYEIPPARK